MGDGSQVCTRIESVEVLVGGQAFIIMTMNGGAGVGIVI